MRAVIDLRRRGEKCTEHPAIKFRSMLAEAIDRGAKEIEMLFNEEDLPLEIVKIFAKRMGLRVVNAERSENFTRVILVTS